MTIVSDLLGKLFAAEAATKKTEFSVVPRITTQVDYNQQVLSANVLLPYTATRDPATGITTFAVPDCLENDVSTLADELELAILAANGADVDAGYTDQVARELSRDYENQRFSFTCTLPYESTYDDVSGDTTFATPDTLLTAPI